MGRLGELMGTPGKVIDTEPDRLTVRKLYEMLKEQGEEFLDVPFGCGVRDQFGHYATMTPPESLWDMPRRGTPNLAPGEPAHLVLQFFLSETHSLRKVKK